MNRFVLLGVGALALAACSKPAPSDTAAPAASPTATAPGAAPAAPVAASDPTLQPPSFDCAKALSEAEKLVCGDARLATLDRQLAAVYQRVQSSPDELDIAAEQRGWIKARDACWQAVDRHRCLLEAYQTRIVELQIGGMPVPAAVKYQCDDASKPVSVVFYNTLDPQAAVVHWGRDQAIVFPAQAASGSRYTREGVEFWEHQGEATLDFYGTTLSCKAVG